MADRRTIWNGEPGTVWTNNTERIRYQFVCSLINTCGACLQYHLAIGGWWPIPIHHRCRCRQIPVAVGQPAPNPFVDFRELLDGMPHDQQVKAIGGANYRLLKAGIVKWEEIVTKYRVRTLREVVAFNKVSLKTMVDAGVKPNVAKTAFEAVHIPEAELIRQHREELINKIKARGVTQEQLVHELARGIVSKVEVAGPAGIQSMASFVANIPHAAGLAAALAAWRPAQKKKPKKKPEPEPNGEEPQP